MLAHSYSYNEALIKRLGGNGRKEAMSINLMASFLGIGIAVIQCRLKMYRNNATFINCFGDTTTRTKSREG